MTRAQHGARERGSGRKARQEQAGRRQQAGRWSGDPAAQLTALTAGRQLAMTVAAAVLLAGAAVALALPARTGRE